MALEDVPGNFIVNYCRGDELQEECLYGLFVSRVSFNLNSWCCRLAVVTFSMDISPNALKECIFVGAVPEIRLELTGQSFSSDLGEGKEFQFTRS